MVPPGNLRQHRELGQVVHEGDMIEVLKTRPDFCYLCDVAPKDSTKRMEHQTAWVFQPDKNYGMFTTYQLVLRISLAHAQFLIDIWINYGPYLVGGDWNHGILSLSHHIGNVIIQTFPKSIIFQKG